jgi:hypothetical protein
VIWTVLVRLDLIGPEARVRIRVLLEPRVSRPSRRSASKFDHGWNSAWWTGGTSVPISSIASAVPTLNFDAPAYAAANVTIVALGNGGRACVGVTRAGPQSGSADLVLYAVRYLPAATRP